MCKGTRDKAASNARTGASAVCAAKAAAPDPRHPAQAHLLPPPNWGYCAYLITALVLGMIKVGSALTSRL